MADKESQRIASIDQYRGYAIFGMIFVNYLGGFDVMPWMFKHHHYGMSYADTIAPLFMFVVGMGMRLSLQRRVEKDGFAAAHLAALRRYMTLIVVGIALYGPSLENWRYWWDALVDIGFAGILALPFLMKSTKVRASAAFGYVILFQILYMTTGYEEWTMKRSIDGGPLGPLSWVFCLLLGTIAYDLIAANDRKRMVRGFIVWGVALCALGWALRFEWPGIKAEWPFTQRGMTIPYPLYSTGLCFLMYLPFYYICDVKGWRFPHLTALGLNPLVIYIVQQALGDMHDGYIVSQESGVALAILGFAAFYLSCYAVAWRLQKDRVIIKL
ncbi:MAG: heparan-alpha-glucosaminide N-acetyltransferase domain-containing protein [Candidatus Hydrogenedentes bacterium]|nr:heparan-alpha-glucosaminide N-acetyltransferase domain-containing protein [Candidatus Hydrogenedentota bacterium]